MNTTNIHEAATHPSRLVEQAASGEPPLVKVLAVDAPVSRHVRRLGVMEGQISVPDDFDRLGTHEIEEMFGGHG